MIIFHEGMPRSGKSLAAMKDHVVPALKAGRRIYARVDGLDHAHLATLADITEERCRELLTVWTEEEAAKLETLTIDNDALIVIDEAQNYWPCQKPPLNPQLTKWVAEHGHHGLDVLLMGQLLKDVHRTWVNRTNRKIQFIKKDMLGKDGEYKWIMYTGSPDSRGNVRFTQVDKGDGVYDPEYFGAYASHSSGTENKGTYADDRINIWNTKAFKFGIPAAGGAVLLAIGMLIWLFTGGLASSTGTKDKPPAKVAAAPVPTRVVEEVTTNAGTNAAVTKRYVDGQEVKPQQQERLERKTMSEQLADVVTDLSKTNRIRLGFLMRSADRTRVVIEWRDTSYRVVDQLDDRDLETLGWHVLTTNNNRMVVLSGPDKTLVATAWPIEEQKQERGEPENNRDRIIRHGTRNAPTMAPQAEAPLPETSVSLTGHAERAPVWARRPYQAI